MPTERRRLIPPTHIISTFRNEGMSDADALSELIDNALDHRATEVVIEFSPGTTRIIDNGVGAPDMNPFICLAQSRSHKDADKIGRYGVGGKYGQMHFGDLVKIHSVNEDRYRHVTVDWGHVETSGNWPFEHSGASRPSRHAPDPIRKGGTLIEILRPVNIRRRYLDPMRERLAHRYRPAILAGKRILIGDRNCLVELPKQIDAISSVMQTVGGEAAGLAFAIRFGQLPEYDSNLHGVHFAFGNRFIAQATRLTGKSLPSRFYAEVMLSAGWKKFLSKDKTKIVSHYEDLCDATAVLLAEWISELDHQAEHAQIEHVNFALKSLMDDIVVLRRGVDGESGSTRKVKTTNPMPGPGPAPDPDPDAEEEEANDRGIAGNINRKKRPEGISFKRDDKLGHIAYVVSLEADDSITINLNGSIPAIAAAYEHPFKLAVLWPTISYAFAYFCRTNAKDIDKYLPGFLDHLNRRGYNVTPENADDLEEKIFAYTLRAQPQKAAKDARVA